MSPAADDDGGGHCPGYLNGYASLSRSVMQSSENEIARASGVNNSWIAISCVSDCDGANVIVDALESDAVCEPPHFCGSAVEGDGGHHVCLWT